MSFRARREGRIAVAIHDIEPATWESCALIRDWLADHGVGRATLLVIRARDLHPLGGRCPESAAAPAHGAGPEAPAVGRTDLSCRRPALLTPRRP